MRVLHIILISWLVAVSTECSETSSAKFKDEVMTRMNPCLTAEMDTELPVDVYTDNGSSNTPTIYELTNPEDNVWI